MHFLSVFREKVCLQRYACICLHNNKVQQQGMEKSRWKGFGRKIFSNPPNSCRRDSEVPGSTTGRKVGCVPNRFIMLPINIAVLGCSENISHFQTLPISSPQLLRFFQSCGPERRTVNIRRSVARPICLEVMREEQAEKNLTPKRFRHLPATPKRLEASCLSGTSEWI